MQAKTLTQKNTFPHPLRRSNFPPLRSCTMFDAVHTSLPLFSSPCGIVYLITANHAHSWTHLSPSPPFLTLGRPRLPYSPLTNHDHTKTTLFFRLPCVGVFNELFLRTHRMVEIIRYFYHYYNPRRGVRQRVFLFETVDFYLGVCMRIRLR